MEEVSDETDNRLERRDRWQDRRKASTTELVAIVTLILQLGALVWFAATLTASVENLEKSSTMQSADIKTIKENITDMKVDIGVLKERK